MKNQKDVITYGSAITRPEKLAAEKTNQNRGEEERQTSSFDKAPRELSEKPSGLWQAGTPAAPQQSAEIRGDATTPTEVSVLSAVEHLRALKLPWRDWTRCGMALYNHFGEYGKKYWMMFADNPNYQDTPKELSRQWERLKKYPSVNIATLFWVAEQNGWINALAEKTNENRETEEQRKTRHPGLRSGVQEERVWIPDQARNDAEFGSPLDCNGSGGTRHPGLRSGVQEERDWIPDNNTPPRNKLRGEDPRARNDAEFGSPLDCNGSGGTRHHRLRSGVQEERVWIPDQARNDAASSQICEDPRFLSAEIYVNPNPTTPTEVSVLSAVEHLCALKLPWRKTPGWKANGRSCAFCRGRRSRPSPIPACSANPSSPPGSSAPAWSR